MKQKPVRRKVFLSLSHSLSLSLSHTHTHTHTLPHLAHASTCIFFVVHQFVLVILQLETDQEDEHQKRETSQEEKEAEG